jgi:UDP-glucose 4-epimerase
VRYLITGGAGFIGSTMADRLVADGHRVVVLDDLSTGRLDNIDHLQGPNLRFVEGSVLDPKLVGDLVAGQDRVVHLAAAVGVHTIVDRPLQSLRTNLAGTETVLDASLDHRVRVLVASTSEIYGKNTSDRLGEDADRIYGSPLRSRWSYAEAKALDELVAHIYARQHGLETVIVRPFNTVGPRQSGRYGMVVPNLVGQALRSAPLTVYGDGSQSRCFLHVDDLVAGMLLLLEAEAAWGLPVNLGGREEISIAALAERIIALTGSDSPITYVPYESAYAPGFEDMRRRVPDTTRAAELVGWVPTRTLDDVLRAVIEHERRNLAGGDAEPEHPQRHAVDV